MQWACFINNVSVKGYGGCMRIAVVALGYTHLGLGTDTLCVGLQPRYSSYYRDKG